MRARDQQLGNRFSARICRSPLFAEHEGILATGLIRTAKPHRLLDPEAAASDRGPSSNVSHTQKHWADCRTDLESRVLGADGGPVAGTVCRRGGLPDSEAEEFTATARSKALFPWGLRVSQVARLDGPAAKSVGWTGTGGVYRPTVDVALHPDQLAFSPVPLIEECQHQRYSDHPATRNHIYPLDRFARPVRSVAPTPGRPLSCSRSTGPKLTEKRSPGGALAIPMPRDRVHRARGSCRCDR